MPVFYDEVSIRAWWQDGRTTLLPLYWGEYEHWHQYSEKYCQLHVIMISHYFNFLFIIKCRYTVVLFIKYLTRILFCLETIFTQHNKVKTCNKQRMH